MKSNTSFLILSAIAARTMSIVLISAVVVYHSASHIIDLIPGNYGVKFFCCVVGLTLGFTFLREAGKCKRTVYIFVSLPFFIIAVIYFAALVKMWNSI